ncbi:MAG: hypothetical protein RR337_06240 [Clostridia bacterium]
MGRYEQQLRGMRRAHLLNIRTTDKAILGIYQRAAKHLARKAAAAKGGSLTERWLVDYEQSVRETVAEMRKAILGEVSAGARASAQLPVDVAADWLGDAMRRVGMDDSFRSVLSSVPTLSLRAMLDGKMYSDKRTLSKRIWDDTGRLGYGVEEVVAQGIAQKQSALQIAKSLEAYVNPNAACPYDWRSVYPNLPFAYNVDYNAQRLARTAINHAYWGANKMSAAENPLCLGMQWLLSDSHYEWQVKNYGKDVCDTYAQHDEGLGKGVYPIDRLPMPHPQCLCTQAQVVPSMEVAVDRLNHWLAGGHDPALTQGFAKWRRENVADEPTQKNRFMDGGRLKITNRTGARLDREMVEAVERTGERLTADFPVLNRLVNQIYLQPEGGIAAFGTGINPRTGIFEAGIALDPAAWKNMDSLRVILNEALASGHTKGTDDPVFIFSHEVGHALHTALALKDAGYTPGGVMTVDQERRYLSLKQAIAQEAFAENEVFASEEYDSKEIIFRAIENEMGWRGFYDGAEFIAQSVAIVYNGNGKHPIADAVIEWLKRRIR